MVEIINVADLPHPDHPGKTYRQVQSSLSHKFNLGTHIWYENRLHYVYDRGRDCDGTPLYTLSTLPREQLDAKVKETLALFIAVGNMSITEANIRLCMEQVVITVRGADESNMEKA